MLESYILFFSLLIWLVLLAYLDFLNISKKASYIFAASSVAILVFLAGIRFSYIGDFQVYLKIWQLPFWTNFYNGTEIGLVFLVGLLKLLGFSSSLVYFFTIACLQGVALWVILKKYTQNPNVFIYIFFCIFYFQFFFNIVRQGLACLLFCLFIYFFEKNQKLKAGLLFVFALSFHYTIVFTLVFYFLIHKVKLSKTKMLWIIFSVAIATILVYALSDFIPVISSLFTFKDYQTYFTHQSILNTGAYISYAAFMLLVAYFACDHIAQKNIVSLAFFGACLMIFLIPFGPFIERFALYFTVFFPVMLSRLLLVKQNAHILFWYFWGTLLVMLFLITYFFMTVPFGAGVIPYQTAFFTLGG